MDIDWDNWVLAGQIVELAIGELHKDGKIKDPEFIMMANAMKYGSILALIFYAAFTKGKKDEVMGFLEKERQTGRTLDAYGEDIMMVLLGRIGLMEDALTFFGLSAEAIKEKQDKFKEKYPDVVEDMAIDPKDISRDIQKILSGAKL